MTAEIIKFKDIQKAKVKPSKPNNNTFRKDLGVFFKSVFEKFSFSIKSQNIVTKQIKIVPKYMKTEATGGMDIWYQVYIDEVPLSHAQNTLQYAESVAKQLAVEYHIDLDIKEDK